MVSLEQSVKKTFIANVFIEKAFENVLEHVFSHFACVKRWFVGCAGKCHGTRPERVPACEQA
jgi:hypothetical protein